jgi:hypothetical protein
MNKIKLFLDLEDTIVDNWDDFLFIPSNCEKIKTYIKEHKITDITVFSFAIDDEDDVITFVKQHQEEVERILDVKINHVMPLTEVTDLLYRGLNLSKYDIKSFGKQAIFLNFIDYIIVDNTTYILIDDMVDNLTITYHDSNNTVKLTNINKW